MTAQIDAAASWLEVKKKKKREFTGEKLPIRQQSQREEMGYRTAAAAEGVEERTQRAVVTAHGAL